MLEKPFTPAEIAAAAAELADELSPPAPPTPEEPTSIPPIPPIEESEHQWRRRKKSNLRQQLRTVWRDGRQWQELIARARPGFQIISVHRLIADDDPERRVTVEIETMRRRARPRKLNGNGNGANHG